MTNFVAGAIVASVMAVFAAQAAEPMVAQIEAKADQASCQYRTDEKASTTFLLVDTNCVPLKAGRVKVLVDNYGARTILPTRTVDLADENPIRVTVGRDTPGFVRVRLVSDDPKSLKLRGNLSFGNYTSDFTYGLGFDVEKIISGTPNVADFDAFWSDARARLASTVPLDARIEPRTLTNTAFRAWRVSFATAQGRRVWGWITEPEDLSAGPYPALVEVAGAGIGFTAPHPGDKGRIVLRMNVHTYPQAEGKGAVAEAERKRLGKEQDELFAKPCGVDVYWQAGIHKSREDYFFYASILGIDRAIDWLVSRPECDAKRIVYAGTSQGGGMGLALTALNKHISRCVVYVPALTDLLGSRIEERKSGWPEIVESQKPENRAATAVNAPYFCGVNFARRITVPIRFVVGYADHACVPNAIHAAYNACPSKDKAIVPGIAMSHRVYDEFYKRFDAWVRE